MRCVKERACELAKNDDSPAYAGTLLRREEGGRGALEPRGNFDLSLRHHSLSKLGLVRVRSCDRAL